MYSAKNNIFYIVDILRGLAAMGVVLFHSRVDLWVGWNEIRANQSLYSTFDKTIAYLSLPMPFLGSTVMLFFILSGFSIHYSNVLKEKIDFKNYIIRRFFRIYPPYLMAVFFSIVLEWTGEFFFLSNVSSQKTVLYTFFMIQNYPPITSQLISNSSLWSLPVEMELYIVYPVFFFLLRHVGKKHTIIIICFISLLALIITLNGYQWLEGNFAKYWIIWISGAVVAEKITIERIKKPKKIIFLFFLFFLMCGILMNLSHVSPVIAHFIWAIAYFFLFYLLVYFAENVNFVRNRVNSFFLYLGKISYSIYLIHFPIFKILGLLYVDFFGTKPTNLLVPILVSILIIPLAGVFYKFIENPSHKMARKWSEPRIYNSN
ncbi:acyltransferase family protein [Runella zeae]|uniref:acyltransferase family protein n=1 Tax=Runella zeae TaxID=94255 RepID=UPI0003FD4328|nr:acyltransferase [Runella zeae]